MRLRLVIAALALFSVPATAQDIDTVLDDHILPSYAQLVADTQALAAAAEANCMNFVPVSGHWGTLPLSMKEAPNGTPSTELYGRV